MEGILIDTLILFLVIFILILLNVAFFIMFKKEKLNLLASGIIMIILAPVIGFSSGALFLYFYDWSSGGTGEGAGYGGIDGANEWIEKLSSKWMKNALLAEREKSLTTYWMPKAMLRLRRQFFKEGEVPFLILR